MNLNFPPFPIEMKLNQIEFIFYSRNKTRKQFKVFFSQFYCSTYLLGIINWNFLKFLSFLSPIGKPLFTQPNKVMRPYKKPQWKHRFRLSRNKMAAFWDLDLEATKTDRSVKKVVSQNLQQNNTLLWEWKGSKKYMIFLHRNCRILLFIPKNSSITYNIEFEEIYKDFSILSIKFNKI